MRRLAYVSPFLLAVAALIGGGVYASVYAQQPPTATPPVLQPPAAPTNLDFGGKGLVWDDNSDNEDGFRIYKTVGGGAPEIVATLPADTTSALRPAVNINEACDGTTFTVVAFNAAGESSPSEGADILGPICDRFPFPFLPDSGSGPVDHPTVNRWLLAVAGVGLALVLVGAGSISVSKRRQRLRQRG